MSAMKLYNVDCVIDMVVLATSEEHAKLVAKRSVKMESDFGKYNCSKIESHDQIPHTWKDVLPHSDPVESASDKKLTQMTTSRAFYFLETEPECALVVLRAAVETFSKFDRSFSLGFTPEQIVNVYKYSLKHSELGPIDKWSDHQINHAILEMKRRD